MKDKILEETFECQNCGTCCRWSGSVLLSEKDISSLATHLALPEEVFIEQYTQLASNRIQLALVDQADGSCIFLKGDRCEVYEARPWQCRSFPFVWRVSSGCPALARLSLH